MDKLINGITVEQWIGLRDFIANYMGYEKFDVAMVMDDFAQKFSIKAMFNFYVWALKEGQDIDWIMSNIMHDLGGRNTSCFEPRTSSYENMEDEDERV